MAERLQRSSLGPVSRKETSVTGVTTNINNNLDLSPGDVPECAVCLQTCIHPVRLPCSHIFCFLCVKGAANQNRRCALCRQDIPVEYFNNPTLVGKKDKDTKEVDLDVETDHYSWFYEGRNGWWQYDERTNVELEESYNAKKRSFELLIAGYMYVIDLDNMVQMRRHDQSRRRRIKRDLVSAPKKGIAGLKIAAHQDGSGTTTGDQQIAEPEKGDTAAGGEVEPPQRNGVGQKSVSGGGSGETKRRTAGVGRDAFANVNQSSVNVDQYDADDDCDESDDDENDVQWLRSHHGLASQRSRPERRGRTELYARVTRNNGTDTEANALPNSRQNSQGLPVRHQRVSSAPETNSGHSTQPVTRRRRAPPVSRGADPPQERVNSTSVDSAIHSLHISTPDEAVYEVEVSTVPVQPPRRELRQRRHRHRQNDDVAL